MSGPAPLLPVFLALTACAGAAPPGGVEAPRQSRTGTATSTASLEGRNPTWSERRFIVRLSKIASRSRGLEFVQPVPVLVQSRQEILRHLFQELEDDKLERSRQIYVALGLLPPDLDVRNLLERVLGEQVAGYYDQDIDQLVIRDEVMHQLGHDGPSETGEAQVTIVHELVHALQDQRLGLGDSNDEERPSDIESAYQAVVEGDATLAMLGYVIEKQGVPLDALTQLPDRLAQFAARATEGQRDPELAQAPAILRVTLLSSYLDGLLFCAALHRQGGWEAVNQAHRQPPVSTEQILHPERYLAGERPDEVEVPELPALADAGYERLDDDRLGELEMRVYFGQENDGVDEAAADGWSGDHLVAYRRDGNIAIVWFTVWDNAAQASEAATAAVRVGDESERGAVMRQGRAVAIVRGLDAPLHPAVRSALRELAEQLPDGPPTGAAAP